MCILRGESPVSDNYAPKGYVPGDNKITLTCEGGATITGKLAVMPITLGVGDKIWYDPLTKALVFIPANNGESRE